MGGDKEIEVGGNAIGENSKITLSVKTALWIIGGVITLFSTVFTYTYFDVKSDVRNYKEKVDQDNKAFVKEIETTLNLKLDKQDVKNDKFIEEMTQMRLNIQQLIDKTQSIKNVTDDPSSIHENTPSNNVPKSTNH